MVSFDISTTVTATDGRKSDQHPGSWPPDGRLMTLTVESVTLNGFLIYSTHLQPEPTTRPKIISLLYDPVWYGQESKYLFWEKKWSTEQIADWNGPLIL